MLTLTPVVRPEPTTTVDRLRTRVTTLEAELTAARAELAEAERHTEREEGWYVHWVGPPGRRMGWLHRAAGSCWWIAPGPGREVMTATRARELWRRERRRLLLCEVCARR